MKPRTNLASHPFWLDGGYDRDSVVACPKHPYHDWWIFQLGEVLEPGACRDPEEWMVICRCCFVPRCGHTGEIAPCLLPRHHRGEHITVRERVS